MSQWGAYRGFVDDEGCTITIRACVVGVVPLSDDPLVDDLVLTHVSGNAAKATTMLAELKAQYIGKKHSEWMPITEVPSPTATAEITNTEAELLALARMTINRIGELQSWFKGWDARLYQIEGDVARIKQKLGMEN